MQASPNLYEQSNGLSELAYFPEPYPDEDYRNIVLRYCHKTNTSLVECMKKLFNVHTKSPNYFPYNLGFLARKLPYDEGEFIDSIIEKNTFFPVFSPFIPTDFSKQMISDFYQVETNKELAILSLRHNIGKEFKFCSRCVKEDIKQGKEPYVHRIHQFNNLDICLYHKTKLISKCPVCNVNLYEETNKDPHLSVSKCKNGHYIDYEECEDIEYTNIKTKVLEGIQFLFENYTTFKVFQLYDYYKVYLVQKGYMEYSGKLNNKAFYKDFLKFYSEDHLIELGYNVKQLKNRLALRLFTNDKYSYDPILHILAINLLAGSIEEFFNEPLPNLHSNIPFGNGPWPCLNITCKYYNEKVVKKCNKHKTRRDNFYGSFLCLHCGFHYQLKHDDNVPTSKYRLWIIDYGGVWKKKLIELYSNGFSQSGIARELNVDKSTVKKHIEKIRIEKFEESTNNSKKEIKSSKTPPLIRKLSDEEYKKLKSIIKELCKNHTITRTKISEIVGPKKYRAMFHMDPEWMNAVLPKIKFNFTEKDWKTIDLTLADEVERHAKELYESNPTRRITKYLILGRLNPSDKKRIIHHPVKLSESMKMIKKYVEGKETYQIRIIPHTLRYMKTTGYNTEPERIYSFSIFKGCSDKVKQEIVSYINTWTEENDDTDI